MSTEQTSQINSTSLEETLEIAEAIGSKLRGGEVIELISDLGGGKTAFTRGLVSGMGSMDTVHSPSFTVSNVYKSNNLSLFHFDFYRLSEPGIIANELSEVINDPEVVVVIEWANIVDDLLPDDRLSIEIKSTSETERQFDLSYSKNLSYLMPDNA